MWQEGFGWIIRIIQKNFATVLTVCLGFYAFRWAYELFQSITTENVPNDNANANANDNANANNYNNNVNNDNSQPAAELRKRPSVKRSESESDNDNDNYNDNGHPLSTPVIDYSSVSRDDFMFQQIEQSYAKAVVMGNKPAKAKSYEEVCPENENNLYNLKS